MEEYCYGSVEEMRGIVAKEATPPGEMWSRVLKRTDGSYYGVAVNSDKCVGCGCCYGVCPFDAIEMEK